jgi:hypothetical protein
LSESRKGTTPSRSDFLGLAAVTGATIAVTGGVASLDALAGGTAVLVCPKGGGEKERRREGERTAGSKRRARVA